MSLKAGALALRGFDEVSADLMEATRELAKLQKAEASMEELGVEMASVEWYTRERGVIIDNAVQGKKMKDMEEEIERELRDWTTRSR